MRPSGSNACFTARISSSSTAASITLELGDLQPTDAVLGAEAAAELAHQVVHGALHGRGAREEARGIAPGAG